MCESVLICTSGQVISTVGVPPEGKHVLQLNMVQSQKILMGNYVREEVCPTESTKLTIKTKGHERFVVQAMLFGNAIPLRDL